MCVGHRGDFSGSLAIADGCFRSACSSLGKAAAVFMATVLFLSSVIRVRAADTSEPRLWSLMG